jgi:polysaccharide biosynthesis/export protein
VTGCATQSASTLSQPGTTEQQTYEYRIGPEDRLAIDVWQNEDVSRTVVVRPDGMITLPLLNDVRAEGLTPEQLRDILATRLEEFIPNVEVAVIVMEIGSIKVSVLGEVQTPGRFVLRDQATILDALALAGGFKEYANRKRIVITRQEGQKRQRYFYNFDNADQAYGADENFMLKRGDIIVVPSRNF